MQVKRLGERRAASAISSSSDQGRFSRHTSHISIPNVADYIPDRVCTAAAAPASQTGGVYTVYLAQISQCCDSDNIYINLVHSIKFKVYIQIMWLHFHENPFPDQNHGISNPFTPRGDPGDLRWE